MDRERHLLQENAKQQVENQKLKKRLENANKNYDEDIGLAMGFGVIYGMMVCAIVFSRS